MKPILLPWDTKRKIQILAICFSVLLSSCTTNDYMANGPSHFSNLAKKEYNLEPSQKMVLEGATALLGKKSLFVNGKRFNLDCSGTVMAIYYYAGIDLSKDFSKYSGGGTSRIYQYLEGHELLYNTNLPEPGDIIFWDNTFDANGDGLRNDMLTHIGIVVEVYIDGTIVYLHEHYKKGIILESMNLLKPNDSDKNSAMRMRGTQMGSQWLASHLYRELAMAYKLKN